jgi:PilZ domain
MPERRRTKRVPTRLKVWCEGEDFTLLAETINVSKTGLFVRTSSPPPSGGELKVTIEELDTVAQVEVRWARSSRDQTRGGMGLHILTFERGAGAYEHYVEQVRSPSGEFRVSWPPVPTDQDPDEEP